MKYKTLTGLLLANALFVSSVQAVVIHRGEVPRASVRTNDPSGARTAPDPDMAPSPSRVTPATPSLNCDDRASGNYLSLAFLYNLMDFPEDISLRRTDRDSVVLRIPKHISACLSLDFEFRNVGSDKIMAVKNNFNFTPENTGKTSSELSSMSLDEKYSACLMNKDLLIENSDGSFSFDRAKAERDGEVIYSTTTEISLGLTDRSQSMQLYFASPEAQRSNYGTVFSDIGVPESPSEWRCLATEQFQSQAPYLYISEEDRLAERAQITCESEDYQQIFRELSELRRSSAGNANELIAILESALESARDKRLAEIYERMGEIENAFTPTREDIAENRISGVTLSEARRLGDEYRDLIEEVNQILYDPAIQEIVQLEEELSGGVSPEREEQIHAEVTELNEMIGAFSQRERQIGRVLDGFREHGLNSHALRIEGFRLKSQQFSRVHPDRDRRIAGQRPITIEQADQNVTRQISRFENTVLTAWEDQQRVRSGDSAPLREIQRATSARWQSMQTEYSRFQQREQREAQRVCASNMLGQPRNPVACQRYMQDRQRREQQFAQRWQSGVAAINQDQQRLAILNQDYETAMREIASMRSEYSGMGTYDDPFGFYSNPYSASDSFGFGNPQFHDPYMSVPGGMIGQPGMQQGLIPPGRW
jgi:hypothetical protein